MEKCVEAQQPARAKHYNCSWSEHNKIDTNTKINYKMIKMSSNIWITRLDYLGSPGDFLQPEMSRIEEKSSNTFTYIPLWIIL